MKQSKVLIIGSGVAGLTTAKAILEAGQGHHVTICSKETPNQNPETSANAYALWVPYKDDIDPRIEGWTDASLAAFQEISRESDSGVILRNNYNLQTQRHDPWYADKYSFFRHAVDGEVTDEYVDAWVLENVPVIDPPKYLLWLKVKLAMLGACFTQKEFKDFETMPTGYDVVINCTGGGAVDLVGDDQITPLHLQVVTVENNGFDRVVVDDVGPNSMVCIVPHGDYIKVGAVMSEGLDQPFVDDFATLDILERCSKVHPDFKVSARNVINVVCASRPNRDRPRVELDSLSDGRPLIHNYGHGSTGFITSHGVAATIVQEIAAL